jgi:biopolymer transport protein ExbD
MVDSDGSEDGTVTGINVTPLVDVMLVLLIVFMVTAQFVSNAGVNVQIPKAASAGNLETPALTVTLDARGGLLLMENRVDETGLISILEREARMDPALRVTLAADQDLPYKQVVAVLDVIKKAGVKRVALAAEK